MVPFQNLLPCAAGAIVAIAVVTGGTFKQVVDSRNRWWRIETGDGWLRWLVVACGWSKQMVAHPNELWVVETGCGGLKWLVDGQNRWWRIETGDGRLKQVVGG